MPKVTNFYELEISPLHGITSKKRLALYLGTDEKSLRRLSKQINSTDPPYKQFTQKQDGKKPREIENPYPELKLLQKKAKRLLSRIKTPAWLMSGKKSVSIHNNAAFHKENKIFLCVDIESFYKHIKKDHVKGCFIHTFQMVEDIAGVLSDLVMYYDGKKTFKNFLPTGAPSSQVIAYWTYHRMFDSINSMAVARGIKMSLYVDDITFSSKKAIPDNFTDLVAEKLKYFGLGLKASKIKKYGAKAYKLVTGCIITPQGTVRVPNKQRKKIIDLMGNDRVEDIEFDRLEKLFGALNSARQVEPNFFPDVYKRVKKRYKELRPLQPKYAKDYKNKHTKNKNLNTRCI